MCCKKVRNSRIRWRVLSEIFESVETVLRVRKLKNTRWCSVRLFWRVLCSDVVAPASGSTRGRIAAGRVWRLGAAAPGPGPTRRRDWERATTACVANTSVGPPLLYTKKYRDYFGALSTLHEISHRPSQLRYHSGMRNSLCVASDLPRPIPAPALPRRPSYAPAAKVCGAVNSLACQHSEVVPILRGVPPSQPCSSPALLPRP